MKTINQLTLLGLFFVLVLSSCSVQKCVHSRGFKINWFEGRNQAEGNEQASTTKAKKTKTLKNENLEKNDIVLTEDNLNISKQAEMPDNFEEVVFEENNSVFPQAFYSNESTSKSAAPAYSSTKNQSHAVAKPMGKAAVKTVLKKAKKNAKNATHDVPVGLLYVLCFFIPWLAVGLVTDWDATPVISNLLWTLLCGVPGIIHAIVVVSRES